MAKKIRLDFSKVEERSGYNSRQMPEGLYEARVSGLENRDAPDGTSMLVYGLAPTQQKYATRNFSYFCKLQQNQLWKLRDLFMAAGETVPKKATQIDPEKILGQKVVIELADGTGQYSDRSEVIAVYPLNTLENLTDDEDDEDEYDEEAEEADDEYEDDESDDDEDFEDDEDDLDGEEDEDEDEDLDEDEDEDEDDEDDEEDEDDEDDEEEDDEEEEEPKPKRAVKRAPAKKAPTKAAAKKAPAKRTVKRAR